MITVPAATPVPVNPMPMEIIPVTLPESTDRVVLVILPVKVAALLDTKAVTTVLFEKDPVKVVEATTV